MKRKWRLNPEAQRVLRYPIPDDTADVAFTLGHREIYDRVLMERARKGRGMLKLGADPVRGYGGGWVWRTALEAQLFGARWPHFAVYGLHLSGCWATDVSKIPADDRVHRLLIDARIIGRYERWL